MQTLELLDLSHLFAEEVSMEEENEDDAADGDMADDVAVEEEDADMSE